MTNLFSESEKQEFVSYLPQPEAPLNYCPPLEFPDIFEAKSLILDLETHGLDPRRGGYIVGIGIRTGDNIFSEYYPIRHTRGPNCDENKTLQWLRGQLKNFHGELIGANVVLFDGDFLQTNGINLQAKWRDIQWAEAVLDEYANDYHLKTLGRKYIGESKIDLTTLYGPNWKNHFREIHPAHARNYSLQDTKLPLLIYEKQKVLLENEHLTELFDLECQLAPLLLYMKQLGIRVDIEAAEKLDQKFVQLLDSERAAIREIAGFDVDYNSGPQIALACDRLEISYPRTEKGNPSFSKPQAISTEMWIERQTHPFIQHIFSGRYIEKLKNTFVRNYILDGHINGRLHCKFHPLRSDEGGTVSGRFSSSDPNLQNIPARGELAKEIRALFLPEQGMQFMAADLSQIEFRLLVHYATLLKCKKAGMAQQMYQTNQETDFHQMVVDLTGFPRDNAKNVNFSLIFGAGIDTTANTLGKSKEETKEILKNYNDKVPFARQMYYKARDVAESKHYIKTLLGRRCRFPIGESSHKALNRLLQGSAADILKKIMVNVWESGLYKKVRPHLTEHDELDCSIELGEIGDCTKKEFKTLMEDSVKLKVPVLAKIKTGNNWAECK